ncbi:cell division protein FtsQ/DivIB [Jatrophihabitans sp. DSM 45814]
MLVVVVAILTWVIAFSSLLGATSVKVTGTKFLSTAQVRQAAAIKQGTPLIRLDTAAVTRRVEALAEVQSAQVTTSYPNAVSISIVERTAIGYRSTGGGFSLVDVDDVAFRPVQVPPTGLPRLDDGATSFASNVATVAGSLSPAVAKLVLSIAAPTAETITLTLRDGRTVLWGDTDRSEDKAKLLPALLTQPGRLFDVSDPDTVISRGSN